MWKKCRAVVVPVCVEKMQRMCEKTNPLSYCWWRTTSCFGRVLGCSTVGACCFVRVSGCSFVGAYSLQLELTLDADLQSCIHDGDEQAESIHCIVSEKERERKKERDKERQRKRERERERKRKKEREQ